MTTVDDLFFDLKDRAQRTFTDLHVELVDAALTGRLDQHYRAVVEAAYTDSRTTRSEVLGALSVLHDELVVDPRIAGVQEAERQLHLLRSNVLECQAALS